MKKIKIVLVATAVLAVVGGALAFKASKFGVSYCIGEPYVQGIAFSDCPNEVQSTTTNATGFYYAKIKPAAGCANQTCPTLGMRDE